MSEEKSLEEIAEELQKQLNDLLVQHLKAPVQAAVSQLPILLERDDWDMDTKRAAVERVQTALTIPIMSALVGTALATQMELRDLLYHLGDAWDQLRAQHMAQIAQDMMNKIPKEKEDA